MESRPDTSAQQVVNEPLRLILSPQERDYIEKRIGRAKRQLAWAVALPVAYGILLAAWLAITGWFRLSGGFIGVAFLLSFVILFGVTFHLLLAGTIDWIMFARYRRNHRGFLNRYNRT